MGRRRVLWIAARCPPGRSSASLSMTRRRLHRRPGQRRRQSGAAWPQAGADLSLPARPDTPPPHATGGRSARSLQQLTARANAELGRRGWGHNMAKAAAPRSQQQPRSLQDLLMLPGSDAYFTMVATSSKKTERSVGEA
jgi:hypothetical protein